MAVEIPLNVNGLFKRADIVVYTKSMKPWMIIECKSPSVALNQKVYDQAARYNLSLQVPYLLVTNGMKLFAAEIDLAGKSVKTLKSLPVYSFEI